ncbi:SulP family inorganic anion transporter [Luteimicrobium sp. NPDC057192]|uniref:SulP family inorganic anion transporter n=1 Tax=Luteimicrobium sp. NPDC057192 TaxID=3346042 RepID=UPI003628F0B7
MSFQAWVRTVAPRREDVRGDLVAGLTGAVSAVPDGMACGLLAGVSPVHGLYATFIGPIAGGPGASTQLMRVTTTSAAALAAASALTAVPAKERVDALVLLTLCAGVLMVVAGALKLGRYVRFVSQSVMLGFLTGLALNIAFGQLDELTGSQAHGSIALTKAWSVVTNPSAWSWPSLATGVGALAILVGLSRTRLSRVAAVFALVVPTLVVVLTGADVARVHDTGEIPRGFPLPSLPTLSALSPDVLVGAVTVAFVVLVQGAGVAEAAPNPDGSRSRTNLDFSAQGAANVACGLFGAQPVGASVSATALNITAGARSRWASIFAGGFVLVFLVALSGIVGAVAMPTLAAILIFAAASSLRPRQVRTLLYAGSTPAIALVVTFVATLLLPVAAAVGVGVVVSLLLQLNREAVDLRVVRLIPRVDSAGPLERRSPRTLEDHDVVVLDVYGSLFYAGARTLERQLPDPAGATDAAVVLRLRGRTTLGATFFVVIAQYADKLEAGGNRLYLSGLSPEVLHVWESRVLAEHLVNVRLYPATEVVLGSTHAAWLDARARRVGRPGPPSS